MSRNISKMLPFSCGSLLASIPSIARSSDRNASMLLWLAWKSLVRVFWGTLLIASGGLSLIHTAAGINHASSARRGMCFRAVGCGREGAPGCGGVTDNELRHAAREFIRPPRRDLGDTHTNTIRSSSRTVKHHLELHQI